MSSRLLAAARQAAARFSGTWRTTGNLPSRGFSLDDMLTTLKREIKHPETREENQGQWHYRNPCPQFSLIYKFKNELLMGAMWYWIMFHFYFEHSHETLPDPAKWTDEELGIPPLEDDTEGLLEA